MSELASNPPLSSYYIAVIGVLAGWSERALHVGLLIPALIVVLGTYRLAQHFTAYPFVAAAATLLSPVFLVSASSVMCDTTMLALWVLGAIFWIKGLDPPKPAYLLLSILALAACTLTKYFGAASIILLLLYTFLRTRKLPRLLWWLLVPITILAVANLWLSGTTKDILLVSIARFAIRSQSATKLSFLAKAAVGLVFAGGCIIPALAYIPVFFSRIQLLIGAALCAMLCVSGAQHWLNLGQPDYSHTTLISVEAAIYLAGGLSIVSLATRDLRRRYTLTGGTNWKVFDPDSCFLFFWVIGTLIFAAFVNWTTNGRSILPAVPAVGILIARGLEIRFAESKKLFAIATTIPLVASGAFSLWAAYADAEIANSQRMAAQWIHNRQQQASGVTWFEGHWGFQYYMQLFGARPVHVGDVVYEPGDYLVIPLNNTSLFHIPRNVLGRTVMVAVSPSLDLTLTTQSPTMGAGFYSSTMGPLPFAFGEVPPERYVIAEIIHPFRISS